MSDVAVVDTTVLVVALVPEARRHRAARNSLTSLDRILLPVIVIYEFVWVMKKLGVKGEVVRNALESMVRNPKVEVLADDGGHVLRALDRLTKERKDLSSFDDKVILDTALGEGVPLLTYDVDLSREAETARVDGGSA